RRSGMLDDRGLGLVLTTLGGTRPVLSTTLFKEADDLVHEARNGHDGVHEQTVRVLLVLLGGSLGDAYPAMPSGL
ncbi:MAG: hypothetical protein FWC87_01450, partial [Acidimicrobiaceae bacterium]|nr:hypothetical protein [Acidimicrobiaceae bacterium]